MKTFVISLATTPERKEACEQHLDSVGLEHEFFDGVDNRVFQLKSTIPYLDDNPNDPCYMTDGQVGCLLSHYTLWKTLQYLPYDEILILEDDAELTPDFKSKFDDLYANLPTDWEFVYVGHYCLDNTPKYIYKEG